MGVDNWIMGKLDVCLMVSLSVTVWRVSVSSHVNGVDICKYVYTFLYVCCS